MSKQRNRNSLLTTLSRTTYSNNIKDELMSMKYVMNKPDLPLYPLNDVDSANESHRVGESDTYPDYQPWNDCGTSCSGPGEDEKLNNSSYLMKGYFESPMVSNEYYSARNIVQATMFSSVENCNNVLKELSQHLANAYRTRNEVINKIKHDSNNFRIPPRVTLTASKKEAWLRDLANPNLPLQKIGERIPHGIRNKVLVDAVCNRNVPINRAIWFTKCVLLGELIMLRKKHQSKTQVNGPFPQYQANSPLDKIEIQWLQEWTQQVVDYIYKFSKEMGAINSIERKQHYMSKFHYILQYVQSLYIECLLDKNYFLSLVFKLFKEGLPLEPLQISQILAVTKLDEDEGNVESVFGQLEFNYGQRLIALAFVKVFWKDILKYDYLCKELSELLLLNYFFIQDISSLRLNANNELPDPIKINILHQISSTITYLFKSNTNVFIIPNYWVLIRGILYKILLDENNEFEEGERDHLHKQLDLIKYRNESLMLNMKQVRPVFSDGQLNHQESDYTAINRSSEDILKVVQQLNNLKLNDELASFLRPSSKQDGDNWRVFLHLVLIWCITSVANKSTTEGILIVCNFIKKRVVQKLNNNNLRVEFENEILEILYNVAENYNSKIIDYNLYVLINELYQLKILTISAYLRKLIASGIFHVANEHEKLQYNSPVKIHLEILQNLPVINNKQCNNILQKWNPDGCTFKEYLDAGKDILKKEFLDKILNNSFDDEFEQKTNSIRKLDVGIKFLLINWLTTELKAEISASPKLVHITPEIITNIYHLYLWCDNLTVFFKDVVRFILKNDGGIIISYLDSLYLIAKLIMKHFKLVKFLAGSFSEVATGYELFNLIILSYKDLVTREFDFYNFSQVWSFIEGSVERAPTLKLQDTVKMNGVFDKETVESPMKINTHDTHISTRSSERLPLSEFHVNLTLVLNLVKSSIDGSELKDLLNNLDLQVEPDNSQSFILQLLDRLFEAKNEDYEIYAIKLLINTKQNLHNESSLLFEDTMKEFTLNKINASDNHDAICSFLKTLIAYEVIQLNELFHFLRIRVNDVDKRRYLGFETALGNANETRVMSAGKLFMLTLVRECFKHTVKFDSFMKFFLESPIFESSLFKCHEDEAFKYIENAIITDTRFFYTELMPKLSLDDLISIVNHLVVMPEEIPVRSLPDLSKIACFVDEINLPMFQLLLRATTVKDLEGQDEATQTKKLEVMLLGCIRNFKFEFSRKNSYFGELFTSLTWEHKRLVLNILENIFLSTSEIRNDKQECSIVLKIEGDEMNLLPIFNDFFKKFSSSSTSTVDFNDGFFDKLCHFLSKLVNLLNRDCFSDDLANDIRDAISIFVRILIIHKLSLTVAIVNQNGNLIKFVKDLISLLNCKFLSERSEKLKILLYDLLLLLKTSITQGVSLLADSEMTADATSPGTLPPHTSPLGDDKQGELHSPGTIGGNSSSSDVSSIFNLPEPTNDNPLQKYLDDAKVDTAITLEEEELSRGGDIHYVNNTNLVLVQTRNDTVSLGSILGEATSATDSPTKPISKPFRLKSFEIFEDSTTSLNDGCINLQLFDAYTKRDNPP